MITLAMIWPRFGPLHHARLRACGKVANVVAIEMSGEDLTYAWDKVPGSDGFRRITLFPGADVDALDPYAVTTSLRQQLATLRPDVVVVPSWGWNYANAALYWALSTNTPVVVMSSSSEIDRQRIWWQEMVKRQIVGRFQAALVAGRLQADYVAKLGIPRDRIFTGYDAVDNDHFIRGASSIRRDEAGARAKLGLPEKYFLSVCRFVAKKNLPLLFRAFAKFKDSSPEAADWHFVLLGDGPMKAELLDLRRELGLDGVLHMPGFKQYEELPSYYGLASGFVLPSLEEQWGLVVNEAMSAGLPVVVSSQCGCAPDLVEQGKNGFVFHPNNEQELAGHMGVLASDPGLRASMGELSTKLVNRFTCDNFARNLLQASQIALSLPRPRHSVGSRVLLPLLMRRKNQLDLGDRMRRL